MMEDCIKYVLNVEYPAQIIDVDDYMTILGTEDFDRNEVAVENSIGDLPETYKNELANRLFTAYTHSGASTILRSNIEHMVTILWDVLPKAVKVQVVRRVDKEIAKGNADVTDKAFQFVQTVKAMRYLSTTARKYKIAPLVLELKDALDEFSREDAAVKSLAVYAAYVPENLVPDYVWGLTHTYVGHTGASAHYARTDFFANKAALWIQS